MTPSKSNSLKSVKGKARKPAAKERRTEILLENVQGQLEVVAEGHQMLAENLAGLRAETKEGFKDQNRQRELANKALTTRMDRLETEMKEGFQDQNSRRELSNKALTKRIDTVAEEVRGLRADVQPRLDDHEARITSLEGKPAA